MKFNKKGSTEYKVIIFGIMFMAILNIFLGYMVDYSIGTITDYDAETAISELTADMGYLSSWITEVLLEVGAIVFGIFGIDFVGAIYVLPLWAGGLLLLFNYAIVFTVIFYIVDRFWIG